MLTISRNIGFWAACAMAAAMCPCVSAQAPAPKALASTEGEVPGVTVAVQELRRGAHTLMLKISVVNKTADSYQPDFGTDDLGLVSSLRDIHLIDLANKKKYFVVRDADGACICSRRLDRIKTNAQVILWAQFALPPDDVQALTVDIPRFVPMDDVPIGR